MAEIGEKVDPDEARELLGTGSARAIDLRPLEEIESGKPPGSVALAEDQDPKDAAEQARRGEDIPILVFCSDGERSAEVARELRDDGIEAAHVDGGWDGWVSSGEPVQPQSDEEYEGPDLVQPGAGGGDSEEDEEEAKLEDDDESE